jgi:hypothetical protein
MNHNPYSAPKATVGDSSPSEQLEMRPRRGAWLTTLLILMIVANTVTAVVYFLVTIGRLVLPGRAPWVAQALLALVLVNLASLIAMWNWRRWGLYAILGTSAMAFVLNLSLGYRLVSAALGFIGPVLLIVAVHAKWKHFR